VAQCVGVAGLKMAAGENIGYGVSAGGGEMGWLA
jgi:hypothetical protein